MSIIFKNKAAAVAIAMAAVFSLYFVAKCIKNFFKVTKTSILFQRKMRLEVKLL